MAYEQLKYQVIKKDGPIEIRKYAPFVIMKAEGPTYLGFRVLFNYISGYNNQHKKINMTVPVLTDIKETDFIAFTMPESVIKEGYPEAIDPRIKIEKQEEKHYLSSTFVGSIKKVGAVIQTLQAYAKLHDIQWIGEPVLLTYQGPLVPTILKKHEVMLEMIR